MTTGFKCLICEQRPATVGAVCKTCQDRIAKERRRVKKLPVHKFVTYRGAVVAMYMSNEKLPSGDTKLKYELVNRNPEKLPAKKTINLDTYVQGYTRETIKKLKAMVLTLSCATYN